MSEEIKCKRFLYSYGGGSKLIKIGVVQDGIALDIELRAALGEFWPAKYSTLEAAFEATFHHGSKFVRWVDTNWVAIYSTPPQEPARTSSRTLATLQAENEKLRGEKTIRLGYGTVEVADGYDYGNHALIFGRNGSGIVGEPTVGNRIMDDGEVLASITFKDETVVKIVIEHLLNILAKIEGEKP